MLVLFDQGTPVPIRPPDPLKFHLMVIDIIRFLFVPCVTND